jgi:hypothetical protein
MDAETFLGAILIAAWAAVVVRGLEQTAVALECAPGAGQVEVSDLTG